MTKAGRSPRRQAAPKASPLIRAIFAYDLSRDIVRELQDCSESVVLVDGDAADEFHDITITDDAVRVVERMIRAALASGGVAP